MAAQRVSRASPTYIIGEGKRCLGCKPFRRVFRRRGVVAHIFWHVLCIALVVAVQDAIMDCSMPALGGTNEMNEIQLAGKTRLTVVL